LAALESQQRARHPVDSKQSGQALGGLGAANLLQPRQIHFQHLPVQKQKGHPRLPGVNGDTSRSLVSTLGNASTSAESMSRGCRITPLRPCQRMKKRTHYRLTFAVWKL
jgi:hypothetical protein